MSQDYGVYIGSAYAATAIAMIALVVRAILDHRAQQRALARLSEGAGADPSAHG